MPSDFQSYRKAEYDFLSMLRKNGFTVYAIHLPGGYFIWDDPDGKIVHFSVQECPQISFGIWFDKQDEHVTGSFFAQFDCIIDKFKPSASLYCCKIGDADEVLRILSFLRDHREQAFCWDYYGMHPDTTPEETAKQKYQEFLAEQQAERDHRTKWDTILLDFANTHILPLYPGSELEEIGYKCIPSWRIKVPLSEPFESCGFYDLFDPESEIDRQVQQEMNSLLQAEQNENASRFSWSCPYDSCILVTNTIPKP